MVDPIQGFNPKISENGFMQVPQPLTEEQRSEVKAILGNYDPSNVTSENAKAIFQSFRDAGIRPGPGLKESITEAGFNTDKLRTLARSNNIQSAKLDTSNENGNSIKLTSLQSLMSILSEYDLENLSDGEQKALYSRLNEEGLLRSGSVIDLSA